ncbi:hypothetical protein D9619_012587 [Psilocybe cf. subviscida]|uniref:Uncharacterized protein n=1 Tax=Psilocybe cf. subviscida TaxID=2480587 RepID=A0A8H5EZ12_9AGAR|nr:hypothetical protein D9619_012587 [Psilocybe cf. subviscida]
MNVPYCLVDDQPHDQEPCLQTCLWDAYRKLVPPPRQGLDTNPSDHWLLQVHRIVVLTITGACSYSPKKKWVAIRQRRLYAGGIARQCGGRPGFVPVNGDRRAVDIPDFSGNRIMTSPENIEVTPLASLSVPSFTSGTPVNHSKFPDIEPLATQPRVVEGRLHVFPKDRLSNNAASFILGTCAFFPWTVYIAPEDEVKMYPSCLSMNHCGGRPPLREMGGQLLFSTSLVTESRPRSGILKPHRSPASPSHRSSLAMFFTSQAPHATSTEVRSADLTTFIWEIEETGDDPKHEPAVQPGQAVILDFQPLLGERGYAHMTPVKPAAVNDDYVPTWTVSHRGPRSKTKKATFASTMWELPGGIVTRKISSNMHKLHPD